MLEVTAILAVAALILTSIGLMLNFSWRTNIIILAVQYLAAFFLFTLVFPLTLAAVKLVVGWMSIAVLGSTIPPLEEQDSTSINQAGRLFRLMVAVMAVILVFSVAPFIIEIVPTGMVIVWGGLILLVMGVLQLGMTTQPASVVLGLLTVLSGFDILYASVETSVMVVGLLALTTLGLALTGAYLMTSMSPGEE